MDRNKIIEVLQQNNVTGLYHTNTVETALSFFCGNGLMSRQECGDRRNFPQTPQASDNLDRNLGIYNDIFFDAVNITERTGVSYYGPVIFEYNAELLLNVNSEIVVYKENPVNNPG